MQDTCLNCYRKHIATANVFENEAKLGYPNHKWFAVGELVAGENEVLKDYPSLAIITRNKRLDYMNEDKPIDTLDLITLSLELEDIEEKD
jgi:hypothetical protein